MEAVLHATVGDTLAFGQRQWQETAPVGILLVDDDDDVLFAVQIMLEDAGFRVFSAASGQKAISFFRDNHDLIDLLVTDVVMPTMNGREVYEQLNKLRPGLPVIFISGYPSDILTELQLAGNMKLLEKPLQLDTLVQAIQDVRQSAH